MNKKEPIAFVNVSKSYSISRYKYSRLSENLSDIIQRLFFKKKKTLQKEKFWAVKDLSLKIKKGSTVGIIGKNGSGKSTILKLISKIIYPEKGQVLVEGRIGAFIELGAGLHPDLTGRENIFLYGSILGMRKKDIGERFENIVNFAEIEKFLDIPIKRYSSGMYSRLGFSVCAFCDPDILLVDEVLAVGDVNFQKKCLLKMKDFTRGDKTVVFVSHDLVAIENICDRVILLDHGKIVANGPAKKIVRLYLDKYAHESLE